MYKIEEFSDPSPSSIHPHFTACVYIYPTKHQLFSLTKSQGPAKRRALGMGTVLVSLLLNLNSSYALFWCFHS